jgi:DNA (cytosine-5)-methyltransferase 1
MKHLGDITKISGYDVEPVDCIIGGSPCQDLSVAGKRAGLDGERSGLFMEQVRIVKEMREHDRSNGRSGLFVRPRYMVWENVPGALSSGKPKGSDFGAVLTEIAKVADPNAPDVPIPQKGWTKAGCIYDEMGRWSIAWRVHDAQFWGTTYMVDDRMLIPGTPQRRKRIALVADFNGLSAPEILFERKSLYGDIDESGEAWEGTPSRTQESTTGTSSDDVAVIENHPNDSRAKIKADGIVQTLSSRMGTGGNNTPMVMHGSVSYNGAGAGGEEISMTLAGDHLNRITDTTALVSEGIDNDSGRQSVL